MPHYKDADNKVHFLDSSEFEHLLPAGCVAITDEEAAALLAPAQPTPEEPQAAGRDARIAAIKAELDALDMKRIRPLAEGDSEYLVTLNAQALVLRQELTTLLTAQENTDASTSGT